MFLSWKPLNGDLLFSKLFQKEIVFEWSKKKKFQGILGDFVTWVFFTYDLIVEDCISF